KFHEKFADVSVLDTLTFFYGMRLGEEIEVEIEEGKTLFIKLVSISEAKSDGTRTVYFELNGQPREITIKDESIESKTEAKQKIDPDNDCHIGATMPGTIVNVNCSEGDQVKKGDPLIITRSEEHTSELQSRFDLV